MSITVFIISITATIVLTYLVDRYLRRRDRADHTRRFLENEEIRRKELEAIRSQQTEMYAIKRRVELEKKKEEDNQS